MEELAKQESLLSVLHEEIAAGKGDAEKEEQIWEVQRICTQLKRKVSALHTRLSFSFRHIIIDSLYVFPLLNMVSVPCVALTFLIFVPFFLIFFLNTMK